MFDYGKPPADDEVELTVFGPGYGEAISVHVGDGNWLLIDSCYSPQSKIPASLEYLQRIGVPYSNVHTIVASHWHDDHVKGLSKIVESCSNATLYISGVFDNNEARAFLSAYGGRAVANHTAGAKELFSAISASKRDVNPTLHKTLIWEDVVQGRNMRAVAFSPTPAASAQSRAQMAQYLPEIHSPIKQVPELKPNLEAIVIHINLGDDAILLGSDLEDHGALGWSSILDNTWCLSNQCASVYKIAHHGSSTGDHSKIWSKLLTKTPLAALTPFVKGSVKLPDPTDLIRILGNTKEAYISSDGTKRPRMSPELVKRMGQMAQNIVPVSTGFGAVRFRKKLDSKDWDVKLFGPAKRLT